MSENDNNQSENDANDATSSTTDSSAEAASSAETGKSKTAGGVQWEQKPDPMASVKKGAGDMLDNMEGKTVSMKTYVGSIIGVIVLMMLARCG